jgi:transposase-like protein
LSIAQGVEVILFGDDSPTGEFRPVKDGQLGPEDDVVLGLRYQLAMTGPDMKAIGTIRQLMEIHQRIHGPRHEAYLELRACLADLLRKSSSDPKSAAVIEATAIFQEVIPVLESALGANHIDTLKAKGNYAHLLSAVHKDNEQARVMRAAVVQGEVDTLGPYHPDTLISRANLAVTLKRLGKVKAAIKEHETVIEGRAASLGQHHEHTVQAKLNLAKLLYKRDIEEAVGLLHECLQSREANPTLLGTEAISVASRLLPNWMHLVKTHRGSTDASSSSSEEDESAEESEAPEIVRSQADDPLLAMIDAGIAHGEKSRKEKSKKRRGGRTQA